MQTAKLQNVCIFNLAAATKPKNAVNLSMQIRSNIQRIQWITGSNWHYTSFIRVAAYLNDKCET